MKRLLTLLLAGLTAHAAIPLDTYDVDAREWAKNKIASVTNTVSNFDYAVVADLCIYMKDHGLRSRVKRMQVYAPSCGLQSMRVPVIADIGPVGVTINDTIVNFVDGDYTVNGLTGDTTTKVMRTTLKLGSFGSIYNQHTAIYNRTSGALNAQFEIAVAETSIGITQFAVNYTGLGTYFQIGNSANCFVAESSGVGFYLGTATSSSFGGIYKNGAFVCSLTPGNSISAA